MTMGALSQVQNFQRIASGCNVNIVKLPDGQVLVDGRPATQQQLYQLSLLPQNKAWMDKIGIKQETYDPRAMSTSTLTPPQSSLFTSMNTNPASAGLDVLEFQSKGNAMMQPPNVSLETDKIQTKAPSFANE